MQIADDQTSRSFWMKGFVLVANIISAIKGDWLMAFGWFRKLAHMTIFKVIR